MSWLRRFIRDQREEHRLAVAGLRARFSCFRTLLGKNNEVLRVMADLEEKSHGEHLFDTNYLRASLETMRQAVDQIVDCMISLGGKAYEPLRERHAAIEAELQAIVEGRRPIERDEHAIAFADLGRERTASVGSKSAQLGEMRSRLHLPVPDGFAISAWAYKRFIDFNALQGRISQLLEKADIRELDDLTRTSEAIVAMVSLSPVPPDLAESIGRAAAELARRAGRTRLSLRSSAIGEDDLTSFAGQYRTVLNVASEELLDRYREVLASKFSRRAIYYLLSHRLSESDLAMGVTCMVMVDALVSGVVYSRNPVGADDGCAVVSAVPGLGQYLVDGTLTPDVFRVRRRDGRVVDARVACQAERLVPSPGGGVAAQELPPEEREQPCIGEKHLGQLAAWAARLEDHYGCAQDLEWALDKEDRLFLLQTRPLRVIAARPGAQAAVASDSRVLRRDGVTVCPGAAVGPVQHVASRRDLAGVREGVVLVSRRPFPALTTVLGRIGALLTEVGGVASHLATLAREARVPMLAGVPDVLALEAGSIVTVDASQAFVYEGAHPELVAARRPDRELFADEAIFETLRRLLTQVAPLGLLHPSDPGFRADRCRTLHDITRFAHQRGIEELFSQARDLGDPRQGGLRLKTRLPLEVRLLCLDEDTLPAGRQRYVDEGDIRSLPLRACWGGILEEGWPSRAGRIDLGGFASVLATQMSAGGGERLAEPSFAMVTREYMVLSLRLGYHFTTIEAMCSPESSDNYVRLQFKGGGATLERRLRRVRLMADLLETLGFDNAGDGDFLDATLAQEEPEAIVERLRLLGRLTMLTKQLDMALSNDSVAEWYASDIRRRLGLKPADGGPP